jgi:CheY-like chemotaxis protein
MGLRPRGNEVRIEIWDTGVGIERDKLNEIFMEFHQLPLADQGGRQGVGLGLAIVERMAKVLGCRIEVQSRVGRGSVFAITLPRVYPSAQQQQACPEPVLNAVASFAGQTVLVMDNEPAVLESMQILLERWGCRVFPAKSEVAALELLDNMEQPPAAILADYHLDQGIRGSDAVHRIRQCVGKKIPAAIITADRSDATLALLRNEKLPVLNKPVKPNRLRALLNSLLA